MLVAGIALAGAVGAPLRYLVDRFVQARTPWVFPLGTFVINVSGSLLLGVISGLALYHAFPGTPDGDSRVGVLRWLHHLLHLHLRDAGARRGA